MRNNAHQTKYTKDLIALACLTDAKLVHTPMKVNVKYRNQFGDPIPDSYLGSLIYLTSTQPDISYTGNIASQYMADPRRSFNCCLLLHMLSKRHLRSRSIFSSAPSLHIIGYADIDCAGCFGTRRFTIGWCMFLGNSTISWKCK